MNQKLFYFLILLLFAIHACNNDTSKVADTAQTKSSSVQSNPKNEPAIEINKDRGEWQKPSLVVSKLGDLTGKTVADIGAGLGYFSFRLVFGAEKVIAVDIDPDMIEFMEDFKSNLPDSLERKFATRLATSDNANLDNVEVDVIIIVNTFAYIEDKVSYLNRLKPSLKFGGRIMIMDYKMKRLSIDAPPKSERIHLSDVEDILAQAGYKNIQSDDTSLDFQYIVFAHVN